MSVAGGVGAGAVAALPLAASALAVARCCQGRKRKLQNHLFNTPGEEGTKVHLSQLRRFSLRELEAAKRNFSNKNILGRGGLSKVYNGPLADGSVVAVKKLNKDCTQGGEFQFQTEVEVISMAEHRNLLRLRGFCLTPIERLLVYPQQEEAFLHEPLFQEDFNYTSYPNAGWMAVDSSSHITPDELSGPR